MEEFQRLRRFPRKVVLYSSTNFRIWKPWAITSNLTRLDLVFWPPSKPFYRKLKYKEKVLEEFHWLRRSLRKMVLYASTNFSILKTWGIVSIVIRFDFTFRQASKPFYIKLKYREKVSEQFQPLPGFPRRMISYSSANFHILKAWQFSHFEAFSHYFQPYKIQFRL